MSEIFTSKESHDSYEKRKDIKCKKWHFVWVSEQETGVVRATQPKPKSVIDDNEYKKEVDGIQANFDGYKVGARNIFFYEPLGKANQISLRVNGCCCPVCMCSKREPEPRDHVYTWGKGTTKYTETISTVLPEIFSSNKLTKEKINCLFGQIWKSQMLRVKLTPNVIEVVGPEHGMIIDAAPERDAPEVGDREVTALEVGEEEVRAPEVAAIVPIIEETGINEAIEVKKKRKKKDDSVAHMVHWVSCDTCTKWRVVNRPYDDSEVFQCVDVASYDRDNANCEVPSVWIDIAVPAVKKRKVRK